MSDSTSSQQHIDRISSETYQKAISDLSALHNMDFDAYLADYKPISGRELFMGRHFHKHNFQHDGELAVALANRLILQKHVKSNMADNSLGVLQFSDDQMLKLRAMYRDGILQDMLRRVQDDRKLIDDYSTQPARVEGRRRALQLPIVRAQDQMKDLRKGMRGQSKKYERQAALDAVKAQRAKYRQMAQKARR